MKKYCPKCEKDTEIYVERTDPKSNGYQFFDEHICSVCEYEFEGEPTDYGELIDEAKLKYENN